MRAWSARSRWSGRRRACSAAGSRGSFTVEGGRGREETMVRRRETMPASVTVAGGRGSRPVARPDDKGPVEETERDHWLRAQRREAATAGRRCVAEPRHNHVGRREVPLDDRPAEWARTAVADCRNEGGLAGAGRPRRPGMLSPPDHVYGIPRTRTTERPGEHITTDRDRRDPDARTLALSDDEKAEGPGHRHAGGRADGTGSSRWNRRPGAALARDPAVKPGRSPFPAEGPAGPDEAGATSVALVDLTRDASVSRTTTA